MMLLSLFYSHALNVTRYSSSLLTIAKNTTSLITPVWKDWFLKGNGITMPSPTKRTLTISYFVHEIRAQGDTTQIIHSNNKSLILCCKICAVIYHCNVDLSLRFLIFFLFIFPSFCFVYSLVILIVLQAAFDCIKPREEIFKQT